MMDSSPVLRQQNHNIHTDILRTKKEQNKMPADPKSSKVLSTLHSSQQNIENQDPGSSGLVRPSHVRPGVSRLPVLAKSVHLQTPTHFTHSHCKWEEKPLAGKAKSKKPCTRPVPFNLSQPKTARVASENQQPLTVLQTRTSKSEKNVCSSQLKTKNINLKHSATLKENGKVTKASENTSHPLGQSGCSNPHKTSSSVSRSSSSASNTVKNSAPASQQPSLGAEACSENMNQLTLTDGSNTSKGSSDKLENFDHDHAALLSILRNEGVTSTTTPLSKEYSYLPGRVSVMKSRQKDEQNTGPLKLAPFSLDPTALQSILQNEGVKALAPSDRATSIFTPQRVPVKKNCAEPVVGPVGSVKRVQFSPDAAALQSILQNEGVKAVGPVGATPRNSVCPSGRGTSIYMAQRVPVRKNRAEGNAVPVVLKESPLQKWTPQRVTRHQPMSAMKWHTTQQSPYAITPGLKSCKANLCPQQEEVIQRLFHDQDEQTADQDFEPQTKSLPDQTSPIKPQSEKEPEEEEDRKMEQEERVAGQPFIQAPERQSVIFFSTGKKMFRDARFKKPEIQANNEQHNPEETLPVPHQSSQINPALQTLPKDILLQKTGAINPAVAMLRKRFPPLEELRMDEEVATYTALSVPAVSGFHPPRPRCGNPLASILHFEESTRFVPISFDMTLSEPDSPHER